jgi:hypothetical protein
MAAAAAHPGAGGGCSLRASTTATAVGKKPVWFVCGEMVGEPGLL